MVTIYDLLNESAAPSAAPVVSEQDSANIASPEHVSNTYKLPEPQPAMPAIPNKPTSGGGMVASIYDLLEKVPRYSEQQMQQPKQYEPTTALEFTPKEVPEVTPEKTSTEFKEELSARDPFKSFAGSAYRMVGMDQAQEGQRQQIEQDTDINYLDRARRGEELAGRLKINPEKVDYMGDMPIITPEMKRGLQQTDVEDLYTYLNQQRRGTRREKGKQLESKGKENIALGEQISPVAPRSRLISQQIEEIGNLDPGLEASFKTGNVSGAVDALVFDAIISGNEEAISQAMSIKDEFSKVAGKKQKYMEEEGFFTKTINATAQMLPMLGKGAAVGSLPVIGPALSTSMWARQGAGEMLAEMEEAGIPREISIPTALNAGLAYSLIESAQVGQVMNTGVKNAIKEPVMKKVKAILTAKGKDWFMENMEEIEQSLVQEYAFRNAAEKSGVPVDAAGKRKDYLQLVTDTFKETAGPMGILSLLGVGGAGIKEFSQKDIEQPPTIEGLKKSGIPKEPIRPDTEQKITIPEGGPSGVVIGEDLKGDQRPTTEQQPTGKTLADFNLTVDDFMDLPADRADEIYFELSPEDQALIDKGETKSIDVEELKKRVQGVEEKVTTPQEQEDVKPEEKKEEVKPSFEEVTDETLEPLGKELEGQIDNVSFGGVQSGVRTDKKTIPATMTFRDEVTKSNVNITKEEGLEGLKKRIEEVRAAQKKEVTSDREDTNRLQSSEQKREKPIKTKPVERGSGKKTSGSGILQKKEIESIPEDTVDPRLIAAEKRVSEKIKNLERAIELSDRNDMPGIAVTGGSGVSKARMRKLNNQLDRRITRAKELEELKGRLAKIRSKIKKQKFGDREKAKKQLVKADVKKVENERFSKIEVGDKIDIGGNEPLEVVKKNKKTVVAKGGTVWKASEIGKVIKKKDRDIEGSQQTLKFAKREDVKISNDQAKKYSDLLFSPKDIKYPKKIYRGVSKNTGRRSAVEEFGLYTTGDIAEAEKYGEVIDMPLSSIPEKPAYFRDYPAFQNFLMEASDRLGVRRISDLTNDPADLLIAAGYDGAMFGSGKDASFVKYPKKNIAKFAKRQEPTTPTTPNKGYSSSYEQRITESIFSSSGKNPAPGSVRIKEGTVPQKRAKGIIQNITGKKVVFVELNDAEMRKAFGHSADGFVLPGKEYTDTIFIDVNTKRPMLWTGFHEFYHYIESNPEYKKLVMDSMKLTDKGMAEMYKNGKSEFNADIIGEMLSRPEFWENLQKKNDTAFQKIANEFIRILSKIIREIKNRITGYKNRSEAKAKYEDMLAEVEPVRNAMAKILSDYSRGKTDVVAGEMATAIRFSRREERKKELIEEKKPLKKEISKNQDRTLNTTYYQIDELQQKRRELRKKLGNIGNENIDQRIIIAEEISKMDALSRDKVIAFISQYANKIGLSAEAKNRIDSIIMNSRGKGGLLRAVGIMDSLMERKQHSRYVKAAKKAISNSHVYLKGIAGKKRATTDIETNRALVKYLEELSGGDDETRKKVDAMISYYSEYGDSDLKKNRENYISELGEDVVLWIEGEDSGVVPEAVKEIIPYLSYKPLQARSNKELIQVIRDIQSLKKEGRTQKSIEEDTRKEKLIKSANMISSSINKKTGLKPKTRADKSFLGGDKKGKKGLLKNAIDFANYDVTMTETILNSLAGDRGRNELTRAVFDPLYNADTKEKVGMRNFNKWYEKTHSDPITGKELKMSKMRKPAIDITVESVLDGELKRVQKTITYADAMKIYAHSKNTNQREHLIWTIMEPSTKVDPKDAQMENDAKREVAEGIIDKVISELPEQYKKMVKATWEYYDKSQHPRMNEVFVKEHGIDMPKEEYYFPIRGLQIDRASGLMERDMLARSGAKASVSKGQTISRIGSRAALGNTDYFEDLLSNITSSEHYIAFNEAIRDVNRIISNPSIKESIKESSDAAWDSIFDWVKAMAYGRMDYGTKDDAADKAIKILRRNHAVFQLGFKALSIMIQPSSYIKGLSGVKKRYAIGSLLRFAKNPYEFSTKINELSPQQEARIKNYEQGIQELMESKFKHMVDKKTKAAQKAYDLFVEIGMKGMGIVDKMVSDWLWDAKFRESIDSGMLVEDSIYEADKIVRKTQSGGGLLASSKFMRGSEFKRMFTQYQSDPMKSWNMLIEFINHFDKMSSAEKFNTVFYGFVLPAFYIYAIRSFRWPWEEPEEVAKEGIRSIVQGLVIAGVLFDAIATLGLDTVKSMRGVPVDKAWYNYISETDAPALGSISKIGEGILRKRPWSIFEGVGEMVGIVGGGQIKRTVEGGNLAIKHKNAKYLVLSRKSANSEFRQVNKAENAEPNDYVTEESATKQNEWAQKKIDSWSKSKREKYYEYQYIEDMNR